MPGDGVRSTVWTVSPGIRRWWCSLCTRLLASTLRGETLQPLEQQSLLHLRRLPQGLRMERYAVNLRTIFTNIINTKATLSVYLFATFSRPNYWTNFDEFWYRDGWNPGEEHDLPFIPIPIPTPTPIPKQRGWDHEVQSGFSDRNWRVQL